MNNIRRSIFEVKLTEDEFIYRTVLTAPLSKLGTKEHRETCFNLLREIAEQPQLSHCNGYDFDKMNMYYNGQSWIIEFSVKINKSHV